MNAATTPPLPVGTLLASKYRLDALLGQGGMGAVYLAENVDIGRKVAVKVLLPEIAADAEALARFKTEARAAAAIGHPNIAEVIDFGTTAEGGAFLVMEYLQGETLGARLRRAGPMEVEAVGWMADELLAAVAAAHAKGVIHRDLKPDNVFLVEQPVRAVKVLDFGVSKFREQGQVALTRTGVVMGTPAYMSPEQARGAKDVGPASDLYAVGAVLYEALVGAPAFKGDSYNEVLAKVLTEPQTPLLSLRPGLPQAVVAVVDRLMAKPVGDRPADAQTARALVAEAFGASSGARGDTLASSPTPAPSMSGFAPTLPRTPAPAFAPTVTPARPPPAPSAAAPTAPAAAPLAAAPANPQPSAPPAAQAPKKERRRWFMAAVLIFLAWQGCHACNRCAGRVKDRARSTVEEAARQAEKEAADETAEPAGEAKEQDPEDVASGTDGGKAAPGARRDEALPSFEKIGEEVGRAVDEAMKKPRPQPLPTR